MEPTQAEIAQTLYSLARAESPVSHYWTRPTLITLAEPEKRLQRLTQAEIDGSGKQERPFMYSGIVKFHRRSLLGRILSWLR